MRANQLIKNNIDTLLRARHQSRKDLAEWCRKSESWISKIFRNANREIPMKYFDRIADFFGIATYQLLQPGISPLTERRKRQRRTGQDRRLSHQLRVMELLKDDIESARRRTLGEDLPVPPAELDGIIAQAQAALREASTILGKYGSPAPRSDSGIDTEKPKTGVGREIHHRRRARAVD